MGADAHFCTGSSSPDFGSFVDCFFDIGLFKNPRFMVKSENIRELNQPKSSTLLQLLDRDGLIRTLRSKFRRLQSESEL